MSHCTEDFWGSLMDHRQLQTTPYVPEHLWSQLHTHSLLLVICLSSDAVHQVVMWHNWMAVNTQRKFLGLVPFHLSAMTWNTIEATDLSQQSSVKSRISRWTDKAFEFILSVITHDGVEGLAGLEVFASDGEQQVSTFAQTEEASRAGHRRHCPPVSSYTVQLDRIELF